MSKRFKQLFSPIRIGNVTVANRIVFPAHLTDLAEHNLPSERQAYYYAERAKGGCGLVITEEQSVHPTDRAYEKLIDAFNEEVVPRYRLITSMVHQYGTRICMGSVSGSRSPFQGSTERDGQNRYLSSD